MAHDVRLLDVDEPDDRLARPYVPLTDTVGRRPPNPPPPPPPPPARRRTAAATAAGRRRSRHHRRRRPPTVIRFEDHVDCFGGEPLAPRGSCASLRRAARSWNFALLAGVHLAGHRRRRLPLPLALALALASAVALAGLAAAPLATGDRMPATELAGLSCASPQSFLAASLPTTPKASRFSSSLISAIGFRATTIARLDALA